MAQIKNWFQEKSPIIALVAIILLVVFALTGGYIIKAFGASESIKAPTVSIEELRARQAVLDVELQTNKVETDTTQKKLDGLVASGNAIRAERQSIDQKIIEAINAPLQATETKPQVGLQ